MLTRLGRPEEARAALLLAVERCANERERALLERKVAALE